MTRISLISFKHSYIYLLTCMSLVAIVFFSCKRTLKDKEMFGTGYKSAPADFTGISGGLTVFNNILGIDISVPDTTTTIRFGVTATDHVYFKADLSHEVTWEINVKGLKSGAEKKLTGLSNVLNATTAKWNGSTDNYNFFRQGELCQIKITFLGSSIVYYDTLKIRNNTSGPISYDGKTIDGVKHILIDDYDNTDGSITKIRSSYSDLNDGTGAATFIESNTKSVNQNFSYHMAGKDNNGNGYLGGVSNASLLDLKGKFTTQKADSFFVNMYVYGYGKANSALMVRTYEQDKDSTAYDEAINDAWLYTIEVNWTGWKLVQLKYTDFKPSGNPLKGGSGNRIREPHKITSLGFELQSYPNPSGDIELNVDYIIITENGRFKP